MRGDTGGNRTPQWHKIRIEQTHGAESDHRDREDSVTYARDAHRRGLRVTIQSNGNLNERVEFSKVRTSWPTSTVGLRRAPSIDGAGPINPTYRDLARRHHDQFVSIS